MPTKNDDVSQSALHSPAHEDEQAAQLKELSERVARLESFIPDRLLSSHALKFLQSLVEADQAIPLSSPAAQQSALAERKQRLLHQLDEWLADDSGYDEETWPRLKAALEQDRLSSRSLFDE